MALSLVTGVAAVLVAAIGAINGSEVTAAAVALLALAITSGAAAALTFLSAARMAEAARASALDGARTQLTELSEAVSIASQRLTAVVSEQDAAHRASDAELRNLTTEVAGLRGAQAAEAETIGARLDAMGRHLKDRLGSAHWHRENLYRQTEDLLALYAQLTPKGSLPPLRGWTISPDLARDVVEHVMETKPTLIVELGSGSSTVLLGLALHNIGAGKVVSLEHDPVYATATARLLNGTGVANLVDVVVAPLIDTKYDDTPVQWYDSSAIDPEAAIDFLLVDGPPGTTAPLARLPASLLFGQMTEGAFVVLDDADRDDEQEIVRRWSEIPGVELVPKDRLEKGAAWLRIGTKTLQNG